MSVLPFGLADIFSDFRAEWSAQLFADFFVAPPYFRQLVEREPRVLIGGRGTGKTTALRSLRFDAASARATATGVAPPKYLGLYIRVNKNRVRAFEGPLNDAKEWERGFAHYFNILACSEMCRLYDWLVAQGVPGTSLQPVADRFGFAECQTSAALQQQLRTAVASLELWVNNPSQATRPLLSIAEAPLRAFAELLEEAGLLAGRTIFCCIDEYENLLDYQQSVLNTYVKLASPPLSYKIGVKRNGLRTRATNDHLDILTAPEDYAEIDIARESFDAFARSVLEHRLQIASSRRGIEISIRAEDFLPELPFSREAELLGCERQADAVTEAVKDAAPDVVALVASLPPAQRYFLKYWAERDGEDLIVLARNWKDNPTEWETRLGNHGYASLFWLSKGRKGARIRKYYTGLRTMLALASGNIRYFIELIDESLATFEADNEQTWHGHIPPVHQTEAARAVAKRRLDQLESLTEHGSSIKRLVLGIGKVFFELARDPVGRAPEQNSFVLSGGPEARAKLESLLQEGVAHLAFEAEPRTKATTEAEMRDDEYRLHPIFAPFFEYSSRKKRRITLRAEDLLDLFAHPNRAIAALLSQREQTPLEDLPLQLALFSPFYGPGTS